MLSFLKEKYCQRGNSAKKYVKLSAIMSKFCVEKCWRKSVSKIIVVYGRVEKYCRIQKNEVNYRISRKLWAKNVVEKCWRKSVSKICVENLCRKLLAKNVGENKVKNIFKIRYHF